VIESYGDHESDHEDRELRREGHESVQEITRVQGSREYRDHESDKRIESYDGDHEDREIRYVRFVLRRSLGFELWNTADIDDSVSII